MDDFINFCIFFSAVLLIVVLTVLGIVAYRNKSGLVYPPVISTCPDYWYDSSTLDPTKRGICFNKMDIGNANCSKNINFSGWNICDKKRWARNCSVTWDGITDSNKVCSSNSYYDSDDVVTTI